MPLDLPPRALPAHQVQMVREVGAQGNPLPLAHALTRDGAPALVIAQAAQPAVPAPLKTFTYCQDAEFVNGSISGNNDFCPVGPDATKALGFKHKQFTVPELMQYKVTLLESPSRGSLREVHHDSHGWHYTPQDGYEGPDRVSFLVEGNGKQVKVVFNFLVVGVMHEQKYKCRSFRFDETG